MLTFIYTFIKYINDLVKQRDILVYVTVYFELNTSFHDRK